MCMVSRKIYPALCEIRIYPKRDRMTPQVKCKQLQTSCCLFAKLYPIILRKCKISCCNMKMVMVIAHTVWGNGKEWLKAAGLPVCPVVGNIIIYLHWKTGEGISDGYMLCSAVQRSVMGKSRWMEERNLNWV